MNRHLGILGAIGLGFLLGSLTPFAKAHPPEDCKCECISSESLSFQVLGPVTQGGPVFPEILGVPVFPEPQPRPLMAATPSDVVAAQKALAVIYRVEGVEAKMDAAEEAEAAEEAAEPSPKK